MASKKRPETQKSPEVVRLRSRRSRSPRELEPQAKRLRVKGSGTAWACDFTYLPFGVLTPELEWGGAPMSLDGPRSPTPQAMHFAGGSTDTRDLVTAPYPHPHPR
jgi:hypothetical protein